MTFFSKTKVRIIFSNTSGSLSKNLGVFCLFYIFVVDSNRSWTFPLQESYDFGIDHGPFLVVTVKEFLWGYPSVLASMGRVQQLECGAMSSVGTLKKPLPDRVTRLRWLFFKGCPGWGANPRSFDFRLFCSVHHFTAEPQRLPPLWWLFTFGQLIEN
jgi:hypothetical protein